MQKEIKLGLVVGFALLLAILLVWYKSGVEVEEGGKTATSGSEAIEDLIAGKPAAKPAAPPAAESEMIPLPPQTGAAGTKPAEGVKPSPAVETIQIPKSVPVKGEIGPPPKPTVPPPPKPVTEVAKATELKVPEVPKPEEPKKEETEAEKPAPPEKKPTPVTEEQTYVVQPGDSLIRIARKFYQDDKKWTVIFEANKSVLHTPDTLYVGIKLKIPPLTAEKPSEVASGKPKPAPKEEAAETEKEKPAAKEEGGKKYTVQKGDTLTSIAEDQLGDGRLWKKIWEANKEIKDPRDLREGQVITIPPK
jgi:nucleoid-associated protein YgaU